MDVINSLLRAARAGNLKRVVDFIEDDLVDINSSNQNGLTALHSASKEGHVHIIEELIARGANVHAKTLKGNTALHIASLGGQEAVVRILIENGADVDVQSVSGFTPLYMAAQENHESIVKLLLANKANQNIATLDGFTPLAVAMQQGHERIASILLNNEAKGMIRFPGTTESGRSLLHIAAKKDDCAAAALLMQNNISPDITSKSGFTALHVACHYGNRNVAQLLIDKEANVNAQAKHNITPLHVAAKWGREQLIDLLLENNAKMDSITRDGLTPLHCAARSGHDLVVENLIRRGAPISAKTRSGLTPLHQAAQDDRLKSAQILLDFGAHVDDVSNDYLTALHVASHCGHVKVAKLLLNNKADPNFRALNGFTSLHIACKKNRIKVVELLLKYGASLNAITESGLTPLHVAAFMGCVEIVIYLLENNANIESVTVRGETPLHLATRANQIDVINVLLHHGANVSARAEESQTALHIAARLGNADIARLLIDKGVNVDAPTKDSYTALHIAAKEGHEDIVSELLNRGAKISCATRNHGFTPLHLASKYGIDGVVDLLLSYGAAVDVQGKNGVTPLHVATHYDHPSVVQLLLQDRGPHSPGASPHAMAKNGYTPLHIAAKDNRLQIAQALLQYGANPNAESKAGFCPIHLASQEGRPEMVALLLNNRANVNCRAKNGITPLHLCAQEDHVNVAQLLVKRGAHLDEQTKGGFTPLHVASHFARIKMIMFLLANGADVNIPAASGYTPLHQASQQGNPEIVELLLQYNAKPDALTDAGQTALSIAQNLGYVSVIDTLKVITETVVKTTKMTVTEEKFKIVAPETMQETFVSDSEDEADDTAHAESVKFLTTDVMKNLRSSMAADDYNTSQSNLMSANSAQQQRMDEMSQDLQYLAREAPLDGGESTFGAAASYSQLAGSQRGDSMAPSPLPLDQMSPDNMDLRRLPPPQLSGFLVSFMVDARGGALRGCRHSGVRVIIPPDTAQMPTRITCRYLRRERLVHPPPLMEGEACASKIMEVGPAGAKFLGPVLIEVPHFASLRGNEREIIILRSDNGQVWREHLLEPDQKLVDSIVEWANWSQLQPDYQASELGDENSAPYAEQHQQQQQERLTRIVTTEFPQYFAIISRIRQEVSIVGPTGNTVASQLNPKVQATFTQGALKKRIKIGLQSNNKQQQQQQQQDGLAIGNSIEHPVSPKDEQQSQHEAGLRAQSPGAAAKRRSRLLACFGSGAGSADLSEEQDLRGYASSGSAGSSGRRACDEQPVKRRHIVEDVVDSDSWPQCSRSPSASPVQQRCPDQPKLRAERTKRLSGAPAATPSPEQLVPDDYYMEPELPLILRSEPKTYGKRLASSAVQTDTAGSKPEALSAHARPLGSKRRGLLSGRRKQKRDQLNILCDALPRRPKSANSNLNETLDSSLELADQQQQQQQLEAKQQVEAELIEDVITSEDQKWRTCTIQTDSASLTVNYVLVADLPEAQVTAAVATSTSFASAGPDDGYVSGGPTESKKSNRLLAVGSNQADLMQPQQPDRPVPEHPKADKAKSKTKTKKRKWRQPEEVEKAKEKEKEKKVEPEGIQSTSESAGLDEQPDSLLESSARSVSPSNKELKRLKREQQRRQKDEKRQLKEAGEAAAKEEKLRRKREKEAIKTEKSQAKAAARQATLPAKTSQASGAPSAPGVPGPTDEASEARTTSVKFAADNAVEQQPSCAEPKDSLISQDEELVQVSISGQLAEEPILPSMTLEQPKLPAEPEVLSKMVSAAGDGQKESAEEQQKEIHVVASQLVEEATETALRSLENSLQEIPSPKRTSSPGKPDKPDKKAAKREAKARQAEQKRLDQQAKKMAKLEAKQAAKLKKQEAKQARKATVKASQSVSPEVSESIEPISSASTGTATKSSSLLGRLFKRPKQTAVIVEPSTVELSGSPLEAAPTRRSVEPEKPEILSEMYPSDPDDADGEMILEVNVPESLIEQVHPYALDYSEQMVNGSSLANDDTLISTSCAVEPSVVDQSAATCAPTSTVELDDQATLVNMSQMVTSSAGLIDGERNHDDEDDDEATENILSQANELGLPESPNAMAVEDSEANLNRNEAQPKDEAQLIAVNESLIEPAAEIRGDESSAPSQLVESGGADVPKPSKSSKKEKELAKKKAKEDEIAKKRELKKQEAQSKMEKKQAEKDAKKQAKEAKEAAKRNKLAKKKENESERKLKQKKGKNGMAPPEQSVAIIEQSVADDEQQGLSMAEPKDAKASTDVVEGEVDDLEQHGLPISTESEVEKIIEEVIDEDGVLTRTTKTIETKYVTLRQEEIRECERQDMPADEYARMVAKEIEPEIKRGERDELLQVAMDQPAELAEILAIGSYFDPNCSAPELSKDKLSFRKSMKKRIKLNQKLVKRALKFADSQKKLARKEAKKAQAEIFTCELAIKEAQKGLARAQKESKKATKEARKQHKHMDKVDKKLAKVELKIEKRQRKIDKKAAKKAKKEAKQRGKELAKESKLQRKASKSSLASRKSIKPEDIGAPVLQTSSRLSIPPVMLEPIGVEEIPSELREPMVELESQLMQEQQEQQNDQESCQQTTANDSAPGNDEIQVVEMTVKDVLSNEDLPVCSPKSLNEPVTEEDNEPELLEKPSDEAKENNKEFDVVSDLPSSNNVDESVLVEQTED